MTTLESHLQARARQRVGSTLRGKWLLEDVVGVGGMAAVYRAKHRNGACVAVKMLHRNLSDHDELRRRFVGEGYAANRIAHPAVVRVLDDDVDDDGTPFLVMEFVEGVTLAEKIQHRRFGDDELLDVGEQVCSVLEAAHAAGVVHRDLKPDNLLVEPSGRIRILDFGIARLLEDDEVSAYCTKTGIAFGTPGFISPEQALGHRQKIGPRTDVFALGATLFYLATGELLHDAETPQELLVLVATQPARLLRKAAPRIAPEVAEIVDRATRMSVVARWQSATAMLDAVREVREARGAASARAAALVTPAISSALVRAELPSAELPLLALPPASSGPATDVPVSVFDMTTRPSLFRPAPRRFYALSLSAVALVAGAAWFLRPAPPAKPAPGPTPIALPALAALEIPTPPAVPVAAKPKEVVIEKKSVPRAARKPKPLEATPAPAPTIGAKRKADPMRIIEALLKVEPRT